MKKNYSVTIFWLAIIAIAVISYMIVSLRELTQASYIKNLGITVSAQDCDDIDTIQLDIVNQSDSRWGMTIMNDNLNIRICEYGSQICCISSALRQFDIAEAPDDLYSMFCEEELYSFDDSDFLSDASTEILQYKYKLLYESPMLHTKSVFDSDDIISLLSDGIPVIVRTTHPLISRYWVVILGVQDGEFIIMDPLRDEYGKLSEYGNLVMQVMYFTEN